MGDYTSADILPLIKATFEFVADFEGEIPGATPRDCGNYTYMDLDEARREARRYLDEVLNHITDSNLNYPE
jgi:S-ribosylhomocysteine lyase